MQIIVYNTSYLYNLPLQLLQEKPNRNHASMEIAIIVKITFSGIIFGIWSKSLVGNQNNVYAPIHEFFLIKLFCEDFLTFGNFSLPLVFFYKNLPPSFLVVHNFTSDERYIHAIKSV